MELHQKDEEIRQKNTQLEQFQVKLADWGEATVNVVLASTLFWSRMTLFT